MCSSGPASTSGIPSHSAAAVPARRCHRRSQAAPRGRSALSLPPAARASAAAPSRALEMLSAAGVDLSVERYTMEKKSTLFVVGLSVHRTPVELRERLAIPEAEAPRVVEVSRRPPEVTHPLPHNHPLTQKYHPCAENINMTAQLVSRRRCHFSQPRSPSTQLREVVNWRTGNLVIGKAMQVPAMYRFIYFYDS